MSPTTSRPLLIVLTLALLASPAARGQQAPADDPLDKARARGLREGHQAETPALRRALRGAARNAYAIRLQRLRAGSDYPDMVLDDLGRLLEADLALAEDRAGRIAARERYWAGCREVELLTLERVEAGIKQFTAADYWAARTDRLLAELRLVGEVTGAGKPAPVSLQIALDDPDPLDSRAPRAEFAAVRARPHRLAEAARDACANEYAVCLRHILGGTTLPDVLLDVWAHRLAVARAAGETPAERLATLEAAWLLSRDIEELTRERVEAGIKQFTQADYYDSRDRRLEATVMMADARRGAGKPLPLQGGLQDPFAALHDDPLDTKALAAKSEATRADVGELNRQRRETLLAGYEQRIQRVRAATDTADVTGAVSRRLLDVELALAGGKAERLAARERQRVRAAEIEGLVRERMEAGIRQFTMADFLEARYDRILAELRIAEARAAKE